MTQQKKKSWYRFQDGTFVKALTFEIAKAKRIAQVEAETEQEDEWHACTCLGFEHSYDCPEKGDEIPF